MSLVCFILAAICNGLMDVLSTRYYVSIFRNFKNKQFWDYNISWRNKWSWGEKSNGEKFFLSSTIFVFLTDGWHLFKGLMLLFLVLSIVLYTPIFGILDGVIYLVAWGISFELIYNSLVFKK